METGLRYAMQIMSPGFLKHRAAPLNSPTGKVFVLVSTAKPGVVVIHSRFSIDWTSGVLPF